MLEGRLCLEAGGGARWRVSISVWGRGESWGWDRGCRIGGALGYDRGMSQCRLFGPLRDGARSGGRRIRCAIGFPEAARLGSHPRLSMS